jgi:hypothetical protein
VFATGPAREAGISRVSGRTDVRAGAHQPEAAGQEKTGREGAIDAEEEREVMADMTREDMVSLIAETTDAEKKAVLEETLAGYDLADSLGPRLVTCFVTACVPKKTGRKP